MLLALLYADALVAPGPASVPRPASAARHAPPSPARIATLPMDAVVTWPMRRCGDGPPDVREAAAASTIDAGCVRLAVRGRGGAGRTLVQRRWVGDAAIDLSGARWRLARAMLPGLEGLVGPGGLGLGLSSELSLVRGAHMMLHLARPRDTRIAATRFAPETTVAGRCDACWTESEAAAAGFNAGRAPFLAGRALLP